VGLSEFTYVLNSTGIIVPLDDVIVMGLTNRGELNRHERSSYSAEWHMIEPSDRITIELHDDETDESMVFIVPEVGLPEPPVSLDNERTGQHTSTSI